MSFTSDEKQKNDLASYQELKSNGMRINSSLAAWIGKYDTLYADVSAEKQAELDTMKNQLINALKNTLGV